jgi:hypothetical protein
MASRKLLRRLLIKELNFEELWKKKPGPLRRHTDDPHRSPPMPLTTISTRRSQPCPHHQASALPTRPPNSISSYQTCATPWLLLLPMPAAVTHVLASHQVLLATVWLRLSTARMLSFLLYLHKQSSEEKQLLSASSPAAPAAHRILLPLEWRHLQFLKSTRSTPCSRSVSRCRA